MAFTVAQNYQCDAGRMLWTEIATRALRQSLCECALSIEKKAPAGGWSATRPPQYDRRSKPR
ncbi:hypothetical protein A6V36_28580 [Paraburkholderia ginsengiterrae]|uniref:Uncharacterized protein n=1 Tax=Paraburkholderia ginsengiterrae TaxID=1462993 RepID=A0A1A9MZ29_9BURK|nr:hypothetical protein A6V37_08725 [Paraburkholderia ginsengiterrae]OAJ59014.1 hypothetical protein A6V36_28580 [Paraburkholderia ginsengiterrae]